MQSDTLSELAKALCAFQEKMPTVGKDKRANTGTFSYAYADLGTVIETAKSHLAANGLSVAQFPHGDGLITYLLHTSGEFIAHEMALLTASTPQQQGSLLTYAKRYAYCAALGIVADEDDDGASATHGGGTTRRPRPEPKPSHEPFPPEEDGIPMFDENGEIILPAAPRSQPPPAASQGGTKAHRPPSDKQLGLLAGLLLPGERDHDKRGAAREAEAQRVLGKGIDACSMAEVSQMIDALKEPA